MTTTPTVLLRLHIGGIIVCKHPKECIVCEPPGSELQTAYCVRLPGGDLQIAYCVQLAKVTSRKSEVLCASNVSDDALTIARPVSIEVAAPSYASRWPCSPHIGKH